MEDKKRTASDAIFAFLDWFEESMVHNDYERGVQFGLMIATKLAEEVEQNGRQ